MTLRVGTTSSIHMKVARFDQHFTSGEVVLHHHYFPPHRALSPLDYPLDELLMINLLARGRSVQKAEA